MLRRQASAMRLSCVRVQNFCLSHLETIEENDIWLLLFSARHFPTRPHSPDNLFYDAYSKNLLLNVLTIP